MLCLQQRLVPFVQAPNDVACGEVTDAAFDSHPECYTQANNSICFLPLSDTTTVVKTIESDDLLSGRSTKQMASVVQTCVRQLAQAMFPFHSNMPRALSARPEALGDVDPQLAEKYRYWHELRQRYGAELHEKVEPRR
jgi:hypothetical protein